VSLTEPHRLIGELVKYGRRSVEIDLWRCRTYLALAEYDNARDALASASDMVSAGNSWRVAWHAAVLALAEAEEREATVSTAVDLFTEVHRSLPGELAPRLALGFCAEHLGQLSEAERHYGVVWRTDRTQASAAFGLARIHLASQARDEAVRILDEVPAVSRYREAARIAAVRVRACRLDDAVLPGPDDLGDAVRRLGAEGTDADPTRVRLVTLVRQAALDLVATAAPESLNGLPVGPVLGSPVTRDGLRGLLFESFRDLADQARNENQRGTLLDLAYAVRPRKRW